MDSHFWLDAVRPPGSGYLLSLKNGTSRSIPFAENKDAPKFIRQCIAEEKDVFVSLAQFKEGSPSRKSEFAESLLSVWLDIDCGDDKPYKNQHEAIKELKVFCKDCKLPKPSSYVNSGGGIHAYWCFDHAVDVAEWVPISQDFKALCISKDFKADPAVMGDPARVMRVPESYNYKISGIPRPVKILRPENNEVIRHDPHELHKLIRRCLPQTKNVSAIPPLLLTTPVFDLPEKILEGKRNTTLLQFAGHLRSQGLEQVEIEKRLLSANSSRCTSPLDEDEVLGIARRYAVKNEGANTAALTNEAPEAGNPTDHIDEVNSKFAWDLSEMNLYNIGTGRYVQTNRFSTHYGNRKINIGTPERPQMIPLGRGWLSHPNRRNAPKVILAPGQPETLPDGSINSWRGYTCNPNQGDFCKIVKKIDA